MSYGVLIGVYFGFFIPCGLLSMHLCNLILLDFLINDNGRDLVFKKFNEFHIMRFWILDDMDSIMKCIFLKCILEKLIYECRI